MHNGNESMSESTATYRSSVLSTLKRACDWSNFPTQEPFAYKRVAYYALLLVNR
jgi:hypothetical protein